MTNLVINVPGEYISLGLVMQSAIEQASKGKGKERHASEGEAYEDQIICEVTRRLGSGYPLGQAVKKIYEAQRLGGERGVAELLGALNYIAAAVIVMREGLEPAPKADNEPEFKPGDAVEWYCFGARGMEFGWHSAAYLRNAEDPDYCVVREPDGRERIVDRRYLRRPEAKAEGCEYKRGDKVQFRVTLPSVSDRIWVDGTYARYDRGCAFPHAVYNDAGYEENVKEEDIRPAPKADGCEELAFDEARMRESMPGIVPQDGPSDFDAPQTREALYQHIVDCNPATFHTPSYAEEQLEHHSRLQAHKPTGEELAEMAEEEEKHE